MVENINELRVKARKILGNIIQEEVKEWEIKGYVVPKEEIEENRRKAYKYLF